MAELERAGHQMSRPPGSERSAAGRWILMVVSLISVTVATAQVPVAAAERLIVETRVVATSDDAEESAGGNVSLTSSDLELVRDGRRDDQVVGLRFRDVEVPSRARITSAHVQFHVDEAGTEPTSLMIAAHASDDAPPFRDVPHDIGLRPTTNASVTWEPPPWGTVGADGEEQRTPDLTRVLQELVDRPGWEAGNAIAVLISGTGQRVAESFDGNPERAPLLHVEYAPTVVLDVIEPAASERSDSPAAARLRFTRVGPIDGDTSVDYRIDGTATGGGDYEHQTGSITIPAGTATADLTIRAIDDGEVEGTETVRVTVVDGTGYRAATSPSATVVIFDDETPLVTISAPDGVAVEGTDPPNAGSFLLTRSGPTLDEVIVNLDVTGSAEADLDYLPLPASVSFPAGATTIPVAVRVLDDTTSEGLEEVIVTIGTGSGYAVGPAASATIAIVDNDPSLAVKVASSADDAEEDPSGDVDANSSDLELVEDPKDGEQLVGMRFEVPVPQGSTITAASVQFVVDKPTDVETELTIGGQAADDATPFSEQPNDLSGRSATAASVAWQPRPWLESGAAGPEQRTPDLAAIVQEIVDRPGWRAGSGLVLLVSGTGMRVADSFDGAAANAPTLHLEYVGRGAPANTPPSVSATADPVVWPGSTTVDGTVTDDLLPDPPGTLTTGWSVVTGPGTVTFGDSTSVATTATFSTPGVYELRLTADDGSASTSDTVTLAVIDPGATAEGSVRFAAIGDFGTGCCAAADVAALVTDLDPDFIITVGDNRYSADIDGAVGQYYSDFIGNYRGEFGPGSPVNRFFPAAGNHDYHEDGGADVHFDYFTLPGAGIPTSRTSGNERYYDFVRGPVHLFVLNSNREESDGRSSTSTQAEWLEAQLAASESPWQVVYLHHPPFSSGSRHGPSEVMRWPFEAWGADAVLAGHEHNYERLTKGTIPYFVVGNGGARLYPQSAQPDPDSDFFYDLDHGALIAEACDSRLAFVFHSVSDGPIDAVALGAPTCDRPAAQAGDGITEPVEDARVAPEPARAGCGSS